MKSEKAELEDKAWRACKGAINSIWQSQLSWCFREPVDEEKHRAPNYYTIITDPQDLLTIRTRLENAKYKSPLEVDAAVRKMCDNAFTYNAEDHDVHKAARSILAQWIDLWESRNVAALWAAAQDPANRAALLHTVSGRRAAAGVAGSVIQQQQQQAQPQPAPNPKLQKQHQQRPRQQSVPLGTTGPELQPRSMSREPSSNGDAREPDSDQQLTAHGQQPQEQHGQREAQTRLQSAESHLVQQQAVQAQQPPRQLSAPVQQPQQQQLAASQPQQKSDQQAPSNLQQQHHKGHARGELQRQSLVQQRMQPLSKPKKLRPRVVSHPPLTPHRILQIPAKLLVGSDHSPVPLLLSLLRAATWLPQLFISSGRLRAQLLGGRSSDPELLLVRCLCSECALQPLPGYMPLTHFYMHSRGAEGDAAGLDEVNTPSTSDVEAEARSTESEVAAGCVMADGGTARLRARVRVADMESLKLRVWSSLRCGCTLDQAMEAPFLERMRQFAEAAGGASLIGRRVWVYHFSTFLSPPNQLYGTWQPALVQGYNAERGEHELRYEREPQSPLELVHLAVNFVHFGDMHPPPGFPPCGPNGETFNMYLDVGSIQKYFAETSVDGFAAQSADAQLATGAAHTCAPPADAADVDQQPSAPRALEPAPIRGQLWSSLPKTHPRNTAAAAVAAAVAAAAAFVKEGPASSAAQLRKLVGNGTAGVPTVAVSAPSVVMFPAAAGAASFPDQGLGQAGASGGCVGGSAFGGSELPSNDPPGSASNAIVIDDEEEAEEAARIAIPHTGGIISPCSLRQAAVMTGQQPQAQPKSQTHLHEHQQQQQVQQTPFLNSHGLTAAGSTGGKSVPLQTMQPHPQPQQYSITGATGQPSIVGVGTWMQPVGAAAVMAPMRQSVNGDKCGSNAAAASWPGVRVGEGQPMAAEAPPVVGSAEAAGRGGGRRSRAATPDQAFFRSLQPTLADPKLNLELDKKCCDFAMRKLLTPEQRRAWEAGGSQAARQQLMNDILKTLNADPAMEQKVAAEAADIKRRYLQRFQEHQQQLQQLARPQTYPGQQELVQQHPQQQLKVPINGVDGRLLQQQQQQQQTQKVQLSTQQQQQQQTQQHLPPSTVAVGAATQQLHHLQPHMQHHPMMMRQYQMKLQQEQQQWHHQQQQRALLHAVGGYGLASAPLTAGLPFSGSGPHPSAHQSVQMPYSATAPRPQPGSGASGAASVQQAPQQAYPYSRHQSCAAPYPQQPGAPGAVPSYAHHMLPRPPPGVAAPAGQTAESPEHQAKRQRFDSSGGSYGMHPQHSPGVRATEPTGQAQQQHLTPKQPHLQPQPQPQPQQLVEQQQTTQQQHSVSPPSLPVAAGGAASSGGRGSVSGGAGEECVAVGNSSGAGVVPAPGSCGGAGRFRPMPTQLTDVIEITRVLVGLMEQLQLSGEEARAVRKALRTLQAAGKDKYIQIAYVTLCSAAKAGDEEEIRDTFEDFRREAARCQ